MLKGLTLLLLCGVAAVHTHQQSGITTYEAMPDVTHEEAYPQESSYGNNIDLDDNEQDKPDEHTGDHNEFFEVTARCGYKIRNRETTVGSISWTAKFEEIAENIQLFAEKCKSLGKDVPNSDSEWEYFKEEHGKSYESPEEDSMRRELYFKRKADIEAHNDLYRQGLVSYSMKLNHFSDMLLEEMSGMLGSDEEGLESLVTLMDDYVPSNLTLPGRLDWRQKGVVTRVKDQGHCGSCWAFSTTGGIEGQWKIHKGRLLSLSEQQLIDCSHRRPDHGCHGGNVVSALSDVYFSGGIESEQSYPYESSLGHEGTCRFNRQKVVATVKGYHRIPSGDERALQDSVANAGPVSVSIHVSENFYHYHKGVFDDPPCMSTGNHAILIVGYGVQSRKDYWLIKNSWGTRWGTAGYGLMSRNKNNQCNIASFATFPAV